MQIKLSHISKCFEKKVALYDVNVVMSSGRLYVFAGENGSGKSTLAKIISGRLDYEGNIFTDESCENDINLRTDIISEKNITLKNNISLDIRRLYDVQIVSQTPVVAESITVKENIFLGIKETEQNQKKLKENLIQWTENLDVNSYVKDIGGAARFYTSLMQTLLKPFDVLILDEPGAYLDVAERIKLFDNLIKLKKENKIIIVISHDKNEIINYADEIILLKKGKIEKQYFEVSKKTQEEKILISQEIKKVIENQDNKIEMKIEENNIFDFSFEVNSLSCRPVNMPLIEDISFSVTSGKLILIKGLAESGLLTLEDALTGMQKNKISGLFTFAKKEKTLSINKLSPSFLRNQLSEKLNLKIAFVASNKSLRASNPELTIEQLLFTSSVPLSVKTLDEYISKIIKASNLEVNKKQKVKSLSGGMLQRLILERELSFEPDLLIMCEPLAGLDMQKTEIIINKLLEVKKRGGSVLVLSTEYFKQNIFDKTYILEGGRLC